MMIKTSILTWLKMIGLVLLFGLCVIVITIVTWLGQPHLPTRAAHLASDALGRKITVDDLQIQWQNPLVINLRNLRVANAAWGSEPEMMHIGTLTAQISLRALWRGRIEYQHLFIQDFDMLLERNAAGLGNWHFGDQPRMPEPIQTTGGIAIIPHNRAQFPLPIDLQLHAALVRLRTSSGKILRIAADNFVMHTANDKSPIHLSWQGTYNNQPAQLNAQMESYDVLHDAQMPYHTNVTIDLSKSKLDYIGTMMNPLDADGLDGHMQIQTSQLGELLHIMGMEQPSSLALTIDGPLTRQGDHWRWHNTTAQLANNALAGDLALDEGAHAKPDHLDLKLSAGALNLKTIWDGLAAGPKMQLTTFQDTTNLFLNLQLNAREFLYGSLRVFLPDIHLGIQPGEVTLYPSKFLWMGGKTMMIGDITAENHLLQFIASASVLGGKITQLADWLHAPPGVLTGDFDIAADLHMSAPILDDALKNNSRGGMVFSMNNGWVATNLLKKITLDLGSLFHRDTAQVPVQCMLGVMSLHNGIGKIHPFELSATTARLNGSGQVDFIRQTLDMVIHSDAARSGRFALDIPLHINGPFSAIGVSPAMNSNIHTFLPRDLSAPLQQLVARNPCMK